jgi:hypothetical protein
VSVGHRPHAAAPDGRFNSPFGSKEEIRADEIAKESVSGLQSSREGEGEPERRRADVRARRIGLQLFTLRSVVTAPRREAQDER